ncbi:MAG TPA: hypothetical protein VH593_13385 [Ktedonobacteraceae bacterium]|jgi:hypothetical protein
MSGGRIDLSRGIEGHNLGVGLAAEDFSIKGTTLWICEQWSEEQCEWVRQRMDKFYDGKYDAVKRKVGISSSTLRELGLAPDLGVKEIAGNLLLNEGIQEAWKLITAAGGTNAYNAANAQIGVGDSSAAEAATQTDLQASTNKLYKGMNATYPSLAAQTESFQSDFLTAEANYAWNEWSIRNGATGDKNLNRKVASLGTKATGTWTLTAQVTLA